MAFRSKEKRLAYSAYKSYRECPQKYKWGYLDRKPKTEPDAPLNRFLGCVWADLMEDFYKSDVIEQAKEAGRGKSAAEAKAAGRRVVDKFLQKQALHHFERYEVKLALSWPKPEERKQYLEELYETLPRFRDVVRVEKLVSPKMYPERAFGFDFKGHYLNGRADLVLLKDTQKKVAVENGSGKLKELVETVTKTYILDGKNSKSPNFLDPDQLLFYSYLLYKETGKFADFMGFLMFRKGVVRWIDNSDKRMEEFLVRLNEAVDGINAGDFDPTPSRNSCKFCDWKSACDEYQEQQKSEKQKKFEESINRNFDDGFGKDIIINV